MPPEKNGDEDKKKVKFGLLDYIAFVIALLQTVLLPFILFLVALVIITFVLLALI